MKKVLALILSALLVVPVSLLAQQAPAPAKKPIVVAQVAEPGAIAAAQAAVAGIGAATWVGIFVAAAILVAAAQDDDAAAPPTATATATGTR